MRKPDFCICENKDADQLRGNQCLCFNGALLTAYLFLLTPNATSRKRNELTRGTSLDRVDSELVKPLGDCAGK